MGSQTYEVQSKRATQDRFVSADSSNTFIADNRKAVLAEVATRLPVVTPFVTKCVGDKTS